MQNSPALCRLGCLGGWGAWRRCWQVDSPCCSGRSLPSAGQLEIPPGLPCPRHRTVSSALPYIGAQGQLRENVRTVVSEI
jgi:hypothetical protein